MDREAFRGMLQARELTEEQIASSIAMAERFEAYLGEPGRAPSADTAWAFSEMLIERGDNTEDNYLALIRFCRLIRDDEMFVALLELADGGEVGDNLYRRVGERFGTEIRDEVFAGIGVAPYGTPSPEKPAFMHPVLERLEARVGHDACSELMSACLRDLPNDAYRPARERFAQAGDIDTYLRRRKEGFVAELEECRREGRPYYAQEVTDDVLDFVRADPEMGGGRREGDVVYETKIPYMTARYLEETDPTLRRYYACHCPWARDAIRDGSVRLEPVLCQCSGGYHKKHLEVIFERPLRVEVLESALEGDDRCRFAIRLPPDALDPTSPQT
jgi:hypothetical protein